MWFLQAALISAVIFWHGWRPPTLEDGLLLYYFIQFVVAQFSRLE